MSSTSPLVAVTKVRLDQESNSVRTLSWVSQVLILFTISKESTSNVEDLGLIPGLGQSPGGGHGNQLQYSCLENLHGQRSLVGCSLWGRKESDTTERLSISSSITVDDGSSSLFSTSCIPGVVLRALPRWTYCTLTTLWEEYYYPHYCREGTETQRGEVTSSKSHSCRATELEFEPRTTWAQDMMPCSYFMLSTQEPHGERQVDRITLPHASIAISVKWIQAICSSSLQLPVQHPALHYTSS